MTLTVNPLIPHPSTNHCSNTQLIHLLFAHIARKKVSPGALNDSTSTPQSQSQTSSNQTDYK